VSFPWFAISCNDEIAKSASLRPNVKSSSPLMWLYLSLEPIEIAVWSWNSPYWRYKLVELENLGNHSKCFGVARLVNTRFEWVTKSIFIVGTISKFKTMDFSPSCFNEAGIDILEIKLTLFDANNCIFNRDISRSGWYINPMMLFRWFLSFRITFKPWCCPYMGESILYRSGRWWVWLTDFKASMYGSETMRSWNNKWWKNSRFFSRKSFMVLIPHHGLLKLLRLSIIRIFKSLSRLKYFNSAYAMT